MQYVNDDMEELFRRAAENYPLDTSKADWSKVASALHAGEPLATPSRKQNKGRFLWLLLLAPFMLICNNDAGKKSQGRAASRYSAMNPAAVAKGKESPTTPRSTINTSLGNTIPFYSSMDDDQHLVPTKKGTSEGGVLKPYAGTSLSFGSDPARDQEALSVENLLLNPENAVLLRTRLPATIPGRFSQPVSQKMLPVKSVLDPIPDQPAARERNRNWRYQKFYAGIMGGIDLTSIKGQQLEQAGYTIGMLAGYRFGKKWSLETGLYLDKKFYYSKGGLFNTRKIYMPPNSKLLEVSGHCRMWELPVAVRYEFSARKQHSWFGTAGLASYFMKEEGYGYKYYYTGSGTTATHYKQYKNGSHHLFSIAQFSGGYIHRLGKAGDLRVEPYLHLPLSGLGIGKLPMMSAGVRIGIVKPLF